MSTFLLTSTLTLGVQPALPAPAVFPGPTGSKIHVEALDPHILRVWVARDGTTTRAPSLAAESAPATRSPLEVQKNGKEIQAKTSALALRLDTHSLAFSFSEEPASASAILTGEIQLKAGEPEWSLTQSLADGERLMGLGQDNHNNGRLDRRGVIRELWAGQQINSGNVTAEYPVPILIGLLPDGRAYGLFFDNAHRLRFDLGKIKSDELRLDAAGGEIDFYVIAGPKIADVIERYTRLTGRPSLPPLWALGYWQSKCTYYDWAALDDAYGQLTARGFPVDVMVIDYDWPEFFNNFKWAKRWFVDGKTPADRIAEYAKKGVKIVTSQSGPMIKQDSPTYAPGWAAGIFATDGAGNPVEAGYYGGKLLDFTHPKINDWLWPQVTERLNDGVAGWWLDLTEPEGEPPQTHYHGGTPANVHNEYSQRVTRSFEGVQLAVNPDRRPFILTRAGSAGSQAHHAAVWTGDVYSDYATLRAHPPEMLNSGLSGLTWWTSDSGGFMEGYYRNDQMGAHARLYERWMQFSVFSPITRAHKAGGLPEPYRFGAAVEQGALHYLKLRYRLLPYLYTYAWEASQTGVPIVRPLALDYQNDAQSLATSGDQYLFGRELLVAPVLYEGQTNRSVYFPPGRWFDWDTGVEYAGGRSWVVAAPQNRIPVAVRAGAIIPLAPEMKNTAERSWDPLTLEIFPEGASSFKLYRDDGGTFGYRRGESTLTTISSEASGKAVVISINESNKKFTAAIYVARFHLQAEPKSVTSSKGEKLAHDWSAETRVLTVSLTAAANETRHGIRVELGAALPPRLAPELKADVVDASGEVSGSGGRPVPHFFPPMGLPNRIKAINYDKGGEGTAFHTTRPLPATAKYRADDFSIIDGTDVGGDYVLGDLRTGEWVRYTINTGNGGYFDLSVRVASAKGGGRMRLLAQDQTVATINIPATGGDGKFADVEVANVYLNPGDNTLMVYVDAPGFSLNAFEFRTAANPASHYVAALGHYRGTCEVGFPGQGTAGRGLLDKLGRVGSGVTYGIFSPLKGSGVLRVRYRNSSGKPVLVAFQAGLQESRKIKVEPSPNNEWQTLELTVDFEAGANRVVFSGVEETWSTITLDQIEYLSAPHGS